MSARDRITLKALRLVLAGASLAALACCAWAAYLAVAGHRIARLQASPYTIDVVRRPYGFSLLAPAYGRQFFPGYISIEVFDAAGRELSSYSVNWDSLYPRTASLAELRADRLLVRLDDATAHISCRIGPGQSLAWTVETR